MPESTVIDLAKVDSWFGFRPGMTRPQVREELQKRGLESGEYGADNITATVEDLELEFTFALDGSERLRQIAVDGEEVFWNGQPLTGVPVDTAARAFEPLGSPMWQNRDATDDPFGAPVEIPATPVSDEELMNESTLWLIDRALGLVVYQGKVAAVVWRDRSDLPGRFDGALTDAQRQFSVRPDLEEYLQKQRMTRVEAARPKDRLAPLRTLLTLAAVAALALIGREALHETQRWSRAEILTGKLVAIEQGPMKQFREYLPGPVQKVWPKVPPHLVDLYRVAYTTPAGAPAEVLLESPDFYIAPREIGDEAQLAYSAEGEAPHEKGITRARDAAFLQYIPWVIALGVFYLIGQGIISLLPWIPRLWSRAKPLLPQSSVRDPDRPELR